MMLQGLSETELEILDDIKAVIDPEVELNVVDLGLIYDIDHDEKEKTIKIDATLSARGCPVGDSIMNQIELVVKNNWIDHDVTVNLVWEPQWTPEMITEEGKKALNM